MAIRNMNNVVLTGVPRSGTTLTCHLLNELPETVALHEPMKPRILKELKTSDAACNSIEDFFFEMRKSLLEYRTAISKHVEGKVPDNPYADQFSGSFRKSRARHGEIRIDPELSADFLLCIKHPAIFTALLDQLVDRFLCFAVIRNPLAVLTSWNSINAPVRRGRGPAAEIFDTNLAQNLDKIEDNTARQMYLLSWYYTKYRALLNPDAIIRYEDIVSSGGKCLTVITAKAESLENTFENKNQNKLYDRKMMHFLGEKLLDDSNGAYWHFYSKDSVHALLNT